MLRVDILLSKDDKVPPKLLMHFKLN